MPTKAALEKQIAKLNTENATLEMQKKASVLKVQRLEKDLVELKGLLSTIRTITRLSE